MCLSTYIRIWTVNDEGDEDVKDNAREKIEYYREYKDV